jgi:hypothetical protein
MDINPKELKQALIKILFARLTPMINGSPGVGKSDIVKQVAQELNLHLIDVRLSQMDSSDIQGYPTIKGDKTKFVPPDVFPIDSDPVPEGKDGFLLFLDEISSATLGTQAAAYKLILDRQVGQYNLHPRVAIIGAGNKATDKAIVNRMGTAMQSRMVHLNLVVNHIDWLDWANTSGIDTRITSFIEFRPELLHNFNPNHQDNTYACPRTWVFTNQLIKDTKALTLIDTKIIAGTVGEGAAREFKAFCEIYEGLPKIQEILKTPDSIHISSLPDVLYATTGLIAANITKDTAKQLTKFVERLPLEFQIITWINAVKRNKEIYSLPEVKQWIKDHAKEVIL